MSRHRDVTLVPKYGATKKLVTFNATRTDAPERLRHENCERFEVGEAEDKDRRPDERVALYKPSVHL